MIFVCNLLFLAFVLGVGGGGLSLLEVLVVGKSSVVQNGKDDLTDDANHDQSQDGSGLKDIFVFDNPGGKNVAKKGQQWFASLVDKFGKGGGGVGGEKFEKKAKEEQCLERVED